jgi:adenosine kinase
MPALICGSLAFDTITNFPGRFAQQILPEQVHILNVSFVVPTLRREWGGCAGNIAYTHKLLGGEPVILAALGSDGDEYLARLKSFGMDTSSVLVAADEHTAQCMIITDQSNNQITAFHPGAMSVAHRAQVPTRQQRADLAIGIIAPDGPRRWRRTRGRCTRPAFRSSSIPASSCRSSTVPSTARCWAWRAGWR